MKNPIKALRQPPMKKRPTQTIRVMAEQPEPTPGDGATSTALIPAPVNPKYNRLPKLAIAIYIFTVISAIIYLIVLLIRALRKYLGSGKADAQTQFVRKSLGEVIKDHRPRCGMTREFVAEQLGVSRQAVSKWENGTSEPTTSNLLALAKLFGVSAEELLQSIE